MNKKLIAAAVSAVVIAPVAQAEMEVYGRINNAIDLNGLSAEDNADSTTDISGVASRFGVKGSSDLGNGLTAHGRYEFATTTDKEGGGVEDTRIATVGLSGAFGRVDIGNQWSAYFNTFGTLVSPTYTLGYYLYSSIGGGAYRASNTIKYSNSFGPVNFQLDARLNDDASPESTAVAERINGDGFGIGLSFDIGSNITVAASYDSEDNGDSRLEPAEFTVTNGQTTPGDDILFTATTTVKVNDGADFTQDEERFGIAVKGNFGNFWGAIGWQNHQRDDIDATVTGYDFNDDGELANDADTAVTFEGTDVETFFIWGGGSIGEKTSWLIGYSKADDGVDADQVLLRSSSEKEDGGVQVSSDTSDSEQITWGLYHNVGGGLRLYYEATSLDIENNNQDGDRHLLGMRFDF